MAKKHELRLALSKAADELEAMAGKTEAEGFKQDVYDALKEKIADLQTQLKRVEEAEKVAASLATPVPGQDRLTPSAPASCSAASRTSRTGRSPARPFARSLRPMPPACGSRRRSSTMLKQSTGASRVVSP